MRMRTRRAEKNGAVSGVPTCASVGRLLHGLAYGKSDTLGAEIDMTNIKIY